MHHQALMWRGPCNVSEMEAVAFLPELAAGLGDGATHTLRSQLLQPLPCQGWDGGFESRFPLQIQENAPARRFSYSALHSHFTATPSARHAAVRSCISDSPRRCRNASHLPAYDHDVVIVGASFAGAACALAAAQYGLRFCVLERKADPGERLHTTGIVVKEAMEQTWLGRMPEHLVQRVANVRLYAPNLRSVLLVAPGYYFSPPIRRT